MGAWVIVRSPALPDRGGFQAQALAQRHAMSAEGCYLRMPGYAGGAEDDPAVTTT